MKSSEHQSGQSEEPIKHDSLNPFHIATEVLNFAPELPCGGLDFAPKLLCSGFDFAAEFLGARFEIPTDFSDIGFENLKSSVDPTEFAIDTVKAFVYPSLE